MSKTIARATNDKGQVVEWRDNETRTDLVFVDGASISLKVGNHGVEDPLLTFISACAVESKTDE